MAPPPGGRGYRARLAIAIGAAALALALPVTASASQTLSVTKNGSGTGVVTSSPGGISCGATCSASFADNATVTLIPASTSGTQAAQWSGCDSVSAEDKCKVTLSGARSVTATFNLIKRQLTVNKAGSGTGTVTSSPAGISCGATCQAGFDHGTAMTLTGTPGAGTEAVIWTGCDSVNGEDKCLVTMSANKTITATFKQPPRQLTVTKAGTGAGTVTSSPVGISCGATCAAPFEGGSSVTLSGSPDANSAAPQWSGCDSVSEGKCKVTMSAAKGVSATFDPAQRQLTLSKAGAGASAATVTSSPAGINCGSTCTASYAHGTPVTLTANPGPHVEAAGWTGCGEITAEDKCVVAMSAAKAVTATFNLEPGFSLYTVTVAKIGTGQGTVTGSPGSINCGSTCSGEYLTGTTLTLNATPSPGSVFAHWSGGGCAGAGPCTTTVNKAKTVKAVFTLSGQRTLTVTKAGTGTGTVSGKAAGIDCGATCSSQVPAGKKVTLSAKAAAGSAFAHWSGACSGAGTCKVTMTEARGVTATFSGGSSAAPPPPSCVVPKLKGKSPRKARAALAAAHCSLGEVIKPIARRGHKFGPLVVKSSSPGAGSTLSAGAKVSLKLKRAAKKHGRAHKRRHG